MLKKYLKFIIPGVVILLVIGFVVYRIFSDPNNLNHRYSLSDFPQVSGEQYQTHIDQMNKEYASLRAGVSDVDLTYRIWNDIGVRKEALKDYKGAEAAFLKAESIDIHNPLATANLATLYKQFLPDYPKSEALYKQAIADNGTAEPYFPDYEALADLYSNFMKDKVSQVEPLMLDGLKKTGLDQTKLGFYVFLTNFFRLTDQTKFQNYRQEVLKIDPHYQI